MKICGWIRQITALHLFTVKWPGQSEIQYYRNNQFHRRQKIFILRFYVSVENYYADGLTFIYYLPLLKAVSWPVPLFYCISLKHGKSHWAFTYKNVWSHTALLSFFFFFYCEQHFKDSFKNDLYIYENFRSAKSHTLKFIYLFQ